MPRRLLQLLLTFLLLPGAAESGKLDARARIALAQLRAGAPKGSTLALDERGRLDAFVVGTVSRAQLEAAGAIVRSEAGDVRTVFLPPDAVDAVAALPGVLRIEGATRLVPQLDRSVPATGLVRGTAPEFFGLNGEGVLVGAIDEGVDYDHEDFKDAQGHTRFVSIWDQTDVTGTPPAGFAYGSEWNHDQLDAGVANERDLTGHGTNVMGILAGDGSATGGGVAPFTYVGMAPLAPMVFIKSNLTSTGIVDAAAYFFARAQQLGMSAALNISVGSHYGPHDGTSPIETALTALSGPGRVICTAAGNDRNSARHAVAHTGLAPALRNIGMYLSNASVGDVVVIAGYYASAEPMNIEVRHPGCLNCANPTTGTGVLAPGTVNAAYPGEMTDAGRLYVENGLTTYPGGTSEIYIEFQATEPGQPFAGNWLFRFSPVTVGATNGRVDLWTVFATPGSSDFNSGRSDDMLVVEPANAPGVISVGAWATKTDWVDCAGVPNQFVPSLGQVGELASFSSPGPTRDGRQKPDLAAPGCEVASATSFDVPVVCSPASAFHLADGMQHTINQGTSMSAPHATGAAALVMQALGPLDGGAIKAWLASHAIADPETGAVPNLDWGFGKLNLSALHSTSVFPGAASLALAPIAPNPLRGDRLRVDFALPRAMDASIALVDVRGRVVAQLVRGARPAGPQSVVAPLGAVAPGLYFVTLATAEGRATRRVLVLP